MHGGLQEARFDQQSHHGAADLHQRLHAHVVGVLGVANVVQPLDLKGGALLPRVAQLLRGGTLGVEGETRLSGARQGLARRAPQHHVGCAELVLDAIEHQPRCGVRHLCQLGAGLACLGGDVRAHGVERGAGQRYAGGQGALHPHVEPTLDRARDELVGDDVDEQAGDHAHDEENTGELHQQTAAEAPAPHAHRETQRAPGQHGHQHDRDEHVHADEPHEVALVHVAVVGRQGEQQQQHERDGAHHRRAHCQSPAHGSGSAHLLACRFGDLCGGRRHCSVSTVLAFRRTLRESSRFQPVRPTVLNCKGRGSCDMSRRN